VNLLVELASTTPHCLDATLRASLLSLDPDLLAAVRKQGTPVLPTP
jgi:hypothetical protein